MRARGKHVTSARSGPDLCAPKQQPGAPRSSSLNGLVGVCGDDAGMWMTQDDADPRRRIAFGSENAARRFASEVPGWSVFSDRDGR